MFVTLDHVQTSLILECLSQALSTKHASTRVVSNCHSILPRYGGNYDCKKFYFTSRRRESISAFLNDGLLAKIRGQNYKDIYKCNGRHFGSKVEGSFAEFLTSPKCVRSKVVDCIFPWKWIHWNNFLWNFSSWLCRLGVLNKDPTVCIDGVRPANTCIPPFFLGNMSEQLHGIPAPKNKFPSINNIKFSVITF